MCWHCERDPTASDTADRARMVQLLRLVEHPDALPAPAALRLARELLDLTHASTLRCDALAHASAPNPTKD